MGGASLSQNGPWSRPPIGPSVGGWITDNYEWRWVFLMNVPVGAILIFLIGFLIQTPNEQASGKAGQSGVDWAGFGFIALSLGCLQIVLDRGQEDDWFSNGLITSLTVIPTVAFILLIWWELSHRNPMVDLQLFRRRDFLGRFFSDVHARVHDPGQHPICCRLSFRRSWATGRPKREKSLHRAAWCSSSSFL